MLWDNTIILNKHWLMWPGHRLDYKHSCHPYSGFWNHQWETVSGLMEKNDPFPSPRLAWEVISHLTLTAWVHPQGSLGKNLFPSARLWVEWTLPCFGVGFFLSAPNVCRNNYKGWCREDSRGPNLNLLNSACFLNKTSSRLCPQDPVTTTIHPKCEFEGCPEKQLSAESA